MNVGLLCVVFNVVVVASVVPKTTLTPDHCEDTFNNGWFKVIFKINQLSILNFPANITMETCEIMMEIVPLLHSYRMLKITPSHGTPCNFGQVQYQNWNGDRVTPTDLCMANNISVLYNIAVLTLADVASSPEFSLVITPTWMCDEGAEDVACCADKFATNIPDYLVGTAGYSKNFTMLCDGQYCMEEAYICDGVTSCGDGGDEGEVCPVSGVTGVVSGARVERVSEWIVVMMCVLILTQ